MKSHVLLPVYAAYAKTAAASLFPDNAQRHGPARGAQGAISGYVHPSTRCREPEKGTVLTSRSARWASARAIPSPCPWMPPWARLDYYEVVGFADPRTSAGSGTGC